MVQDPKKEKTGDKVASLFEAARKAGAKDGPALAAPSAAGPAKPAAFTGSANTLSGAPPAGQAPPGSGAGAAATGPPAQVAHVITFFRNGFTVDGGPLRLMDDPANAPFLQARWVCDSTSLLSCHHTHHVPVAPLSHPYSHPLSHPRPCRMPSAGHRRGRVSGGAASRGPAHGRARVACAQG